MEGTPFLPLSDGLHIERVTASAHELLIQVISSSPKACCPLCGTQAWRIHSRYTREVADLPCAGRHVTLLLTVRKFFCPDPACLRNIFAEQFPDLVPSYARLTTRLRESLVALGLATCGEVASRLAPRLDCRSHRLHCCDVYEPFQRLQREGYGSLESMILP